MPSVFNAFLTFFTIYIAHLFVFSPWFGIQQAAAVVVLCSFLVSLALFTYRVKTSEKVSATNTLLLPQLNV